MIKKILSVVFLLAFAVSMHAGAVVIQGEVSPGVYTNIKADSLGNISSGASSGTLVNRSGTITLGGTAQVLAAANSTRKYLFIQNISSGNLYINFTTTAVTTQPSILIVPNASFVMEGSFVSTEAISIIGATTSQAFVAKEF